MDTIRSKRWTPFQSCVGGTGLKSSCQTMSPKPASPSAFPRNKYD